MNDISNAAETIGHSILARIPGKIKNIDIEFESKYIETTDGTIYAVSVTGPLIWNKSRNSSKRKSQL